MKKFLNKNVFIILIIVLAVFRFLLMTKMTVIQNATAGVDDGWVVFTAKNLKDGAWQGIYSCNIMIKGITAPFILAFSSMLGISYINLVTIMYICSIILFIYSLKDIIKNKYILFMIYVILLFNPIMYGKEVIQRVYRNSFVPSFSIAIISMYILMLVDKNKDIKNMIFYNIILGILFALFWNLREDSIWLVPLMLFMSIFIFLEQYKNSRKILTNILILCIPLIITLIINNMICLTNYFYYGVYQRLDFSSNTTFSKLCNYMKKVEYADIDDRRSFSIDKLKMLCEVSPTLNEYSEMFFKYISFYDAIDNSPNDGMLDNGWFTWSVRSAVDYSRKYHTFEESNEFYNQIYKELEQATNEGKIKVKKGFYNSKRTINNIIKSIGNAVIYIINFNEIESDIDSESIYEFDIVKNMYEEISLNKMIYSKKDIETYKVANLEEQNNYLRKYGNLDNILNNIIKGYQKVNWILFIIGIIGYITITYSLIVKKDFEHKNIWIIMSGLIGSIFTNICGVAYINITACDAIKYAYLSGTYSFLIAFEIVGIYYLVLNINKFRRKKSE